MLALTLKTFLYVVFFGYSGPYIPYGWYPTEIGDENDCKDAIEASNYFFDSHPVPNTRGCVDALNSEEAKKLVLKELNNNIKEN